MTRPSRRPLWVRLVLWATALLGALLAAGALLLVASVSGGLDDLLDLHTPHAGDREVVQAQQRTLEDLRDDAAALPVAAVATATGSTCEVGEHDWKVDDGFDLACTALRGTATDGATSSYRTDTLALHEQLLGDGWTGDGLDLRTVVVDYWDTRADRRRAGFPEGYGPAELPSARYVRGDQVLEVSWLAAGRSGSLPEGLQWDPTAPRPGAGRYSAVLVLARESFRA